MDLLPRYSTSEAIVLMASVLDRVDDPERERLGHEERLALLRSARQLQDRVVGLTGVLMAETDAARSAQAVAGMQLATMLATHEHRDAREVNREVRRAGEVAKDARVAKRVLAGELSPAHGQGIAKALEEMPWDLSPSQHRDVFDRLVQKAGEASPREVAGSAAEVLLEVAPERVPSPTDVDAQVAAQRRSAWRNRRLSWGVSEENPGQYWFSATLPAIEAQQVLTSIRHLVAAGKRERAQRGESRGTRPTDAQCAADALVELAAGWSKSASADAEPNFDADRSGSAGDSASAEAHAVAEDSVTLDRGVRRPTLVVTVDFDRLVDRAQGAGVLADGEPVSARDLRRICCDADVLPVVLGSASQPLDVGRRERLVPAGMRDALRVRDKHCIFPGCTVSAVECEAHHVVPWWNGGVTALLNLVLLCPYHHSVVEPRRPDGKVSASGWEVTFDPVTELPDLHRRE